jgi:hypothetical protein
VTRYLAADEVPVERVRVRARGVRVRTNSRGRATLRLKAHAKGPIVVRARKPGFDQDKVVVG